MTRQYIVLQAWLRNLQERQSERGATAVEYGLIVALIAAVIIGVVATLGGKIHDAFYDIASQL